MDDDVAHVRIVDGLLRLGFPGSMRARVIGKNSHYVELRAVAELRAVEALQFTAKDEVEELIGSA